MSVRGEAEGQKVARPKVAACRRTPHPKLPIDTLAKSRGIAEGTPTLQKCRHGDAGASAGEGVLYQLAPLRHAPLSHPFEAISAAHFILCFRGYPTRGRQQGLSAGH